jgi:uncharacterized protein (TIGR02996 family)
VTAEHSPAVMAIVSKAIFEKLAKGASPGTVVPLDRYNSANKALDPLGSGGRLFLLTVRPEKERLWLVAVLENLSYMKDAWVAAAPNRIPITDVSSLRSQIKFESGKGITAKEGALAMSLQTPRLLAPSDVEILLAAAGGGAAPASAAASPAGAAPATSAAARAAEETRVKLLRAIFEDPDDDGPRLVYADWLQEQGDPRGELISVQCTLATGPEFHSQRLSLRQRERELLELHGEAWAAPAKKVADTWAFRRGFVDEVAGPAKKVLAGAAGLCEIEPVRRLSLSGVTAKECATLGAAAWMTLVQRMRLRGSLKNPAASSLFASPHLVSVISLNLGECKIGPAEAAALAAARIRGLRSLSLSGNPVGDKGLAALLDTPLLGRCRRLYLARARLTDASAIALSRASHLDGLTGLCLGGNEIGDEGARALARAPHLKGLKRLEVDDGFSDEVRTLLGEKFGRALKLTISSGDYGGGDDGDDEEMDDEE